MSAAPAIAASWTLPTDEDDRAELEAFGILQKDSPEIGVPSNPSELDAAISTVLRQIGKAQLDFDRYQATREREHMAIDARYDRVTDPIAKRIAWLESVGQQLAREAHFPGKAKSRKVAFGSYGKRKAGGKLQIVDADALLIWAHACDAPEKLIETKTTERVPHAAAVAYLETTGIVPHGCEWIDEYDDPFVKPDTSALQDTP